MSEVNLGQLIITREPKQRRDAIHIAVIEMEAVEMLEPGQAVGVVPNTDGIKASAGCEHVGIVDPLLKHQVSPGERFWMVMNPKTVTDLRHDWNHPAFEKPVNKKGNGRRESMEFIRSFGDELDMNYTRTKREARRFLRWGNTVAIVGRTISESTRNKVGLFWQHYANVTGEEVPEDKRVQFFFEVEIGINVPYVTGITIPAMPPPPAGYIITTTSTANPDWTRTMPAGAGTTIRPVNPAPAPEIEPEDDGCSGC